ncbi:uncharacterized protein N7511_000598 [Penicillium nucicola]|uniref:uncharacterized protein n=1 Tax=Penicillium nucicola TaxID=1850975 RepID=UPI0025457F4B|nr:uncharacterized protein N7511_000598 [Penicillium nucicola]KAJ5775587.1 hypothetical protein N7511_000598 [Penicillium nucicola]
MLPIQASAEINPDFPKDAKEIIKIQLRPNIHWSMSMNLLPPVSTSQMALELMQHFQQNMAGKLAWVDSPKNPWRQVIIPLAHVSSTVLYAVLSLSSEDLSYHYTQDHPRHTHLQHISHQYRNEALALLAKRISSLRENEISHAGSYDSNEIRYALASMLILYNVELLGAEPIKWRMHLQAARVMLQWREQTSSRATSLDEIDTFLVYEHYYASVFAGLTTFDTADELPGDRFEHFDDITMFSDFVRVIHRVTQIERVAYDRRTNVEPSQIQDIIFEVEAARQRMAHLGQKLHLQNYHVQQDFQHLVYIFYHASLIYTYRVLRNDSATDPIAQASRDSILNHLYSLSNKETFAHDVVWPLFILGTEGKGHPELQEIVSREMEAVMKISGALDRRKVLFFLQQYWSLDLDPGANWMYLMREMIPGNSMLIL